MSDKLEELRQEATSEEMAYQPDFNQPHPLDPPVLRHKKNRVYHHPGQPQMQVEVILASMPVGSQDHKPIITVRMRYPRPIHGEIMTHRVFGRNARSSRAVPVRTMLDEVRRIPYVPWHWGKNQSGMQAEEECSELIELDIPQVDEITQEMDYEIVRMKNEEAWLHARTEAADVAEAFMNAGYHKQNPNRLLEPFSWIDTLITSTEWDNFLWLRDHHDAEPHLQDLARLVKEAFLHMNIQPLQKDEWHQPYISASDIQNLIMRPDRETERMIDEMGCDGDELLNMVSAARCARISYKPFDGNASYEKEIDRYNLLVSSDRVHASPLEHQAKADKPLICPTSGQFHGWVEPHLHGNLNGYIQARKLVPNEVHTAITAL